MWYKHLQAYNFQCHKLEIQLNSIFRREKIFSFVEEGVYTFFHKQGSDIN